MSFEFFYSIVYGILWGIVVLVLNVKMMKREFWIFCFVYLFFYFCVLVILLDNGFLSINLKDLRICGFVVWEKII